MLFLKQIIVENFKSFRGRLIIGPLKKFNAVLGPNGSGKSNFMDAISFVMGERIQTLRVERICDLIHGAIIGKPISKSASVSAVFIVDDEGKELMFQRSILGSSSEYRINGSVVSNQEYLDALEENLQINVRAKNFLVFQGTVESVATKDPKEMTTMLEEISGSGAFKDDYERLKQEMLNAHPEPEHYNKDEIEALAFRNLQVILTPKLKAMEKPKLAETNEELETLRNQSNKKDAFKKIKHLRYEQFSRCFHHVYDEIYNIYKSLALDQSARACLLAENPEEPYLDEIIYYSVAPGKTLQPMSNVSGGEKTIAALALLFAIHSFQPTPILILDQVDASLDDDNLEKVAKYIRKKTSSFQTIIMSHTHNDVFCAHADVLIAMNSQPSDCGESHVVTVDLKYCPHH